MAPSGVLHVGAHLGEESKVCESLGWHPIIWVEAQPNLVRTLREKLDPTIHTVIQAAVWDESGIDKEFHVTSNSQSSSLLKLGSHATDYPDIVVTENFTITTQRLDEIADLDQSIKFLNLDLQGVEGRAIIGLGNNIEKFDYVYTEVNRKQVYEGCTLIGELDQILRNLNFYRVATRWVPFKGWGDALYVNQNLGRISFFRILKLNSWQLSYILKEYCLALLRGVKSKISRISAS